MSSIAWQEQQNPVANKTKLTEACFLLFRKIFTCSWSPRCRPTAPKSKSDGSWEATLQAN